MVTSVARIILFGACVLWGAPGWSQGYPAKPVRVVVGFSAGSTTDLIGRVLAAAYLRSETEKYAKVVKAIGLRIE